MQEWPDFFQVDDVPPVRKTDLKPKPKLGNFRSMESLLQEYDIRNQLDQKMSEYESLSQSNHGSVHKARSASMGANDVNSAKNRILSQQDATSNGDYKESDYECLSQHGISMETFNLIATKEKLEDEAK